jgi:hypothetical protein
MNLLTASEMAESLGIDQKTFYRWRELGKIKPKGGTGKKPLFDLADGVAIQLAKKGAKEASRRTYDDLMQSVLRRWKSKVRISRQALENHKEQYLDYSELSGLWGSIVGRSIDEIGKLPAAIANLAKGVEDIARASEIIRQRVYSTLTRLASSNDDAYIESLPEDAEDTEIEAPEGADVSDLIEIERTRHNNLVSELNERRAEVAAGKLLDVQIAESAMMQMIGIARVKLLTLSGGVARLIAAQERKDIVKILADEIEVITSELKPVLSVPRPNEEVAEDEDNEAEG